MKAWTLATRRPLRGEVRVPGDKSISHRALMLGAIAEGVTVIRGLSDGADVRSTRECLGRMDVLIEDAGELVRGPGGEAWSQVRVHGRGAAGLAAPKGALPCGNSGTTMRLLMGLAAGRPAAFRFTGDASLRRRPMGRVAAPLRAMGAGVELSKGDVAPLTVRGGALKGIAFQSPVASAQVKSAVLLAGLSASGETSVTEPAPSRDHTERMLGAFGVPVGREGLRVWVHGGARPRAADVAVPGDLSSAAFWLVAACLVPDSSLRVCGVGVNPTRAGALDVLARMGARLEIARTDGDPDGEPVADVTASAGSLVAVETDPREFPSLVDEAPILAVAATQARGTTRIRGAGELRHKESDRIAGVLRMLEALGAKASVHGDDLVIPGPQALRAGTVDPEDDHRIAMAGAVAAAAAAGECKVLDPGCADISYPGFFAALGERLHG